MPDSRDASRADALMEPVARGYTRARVLAAAVQARTKLIENSDAVRRLSVEEVAALAEAIEAIDGLIDVVGANVSRSGGR